MSTLIKRKQQKDFKTDAEYLRIIKDPDTPEKTRNEYIYELYTKYIPLIRKMANKFNLAAEDFQDYESEAFFEVLAVIDYTDMDMIDENYSFGYFLRYRLLNKGIRGVKDSQRREKYLGSKTSWESITENSNFVPTELTTDGEDEFEKIHIDADRHRVIEMLESFKEIPPRNKKIMKDSLAGFDSRELSNRYNLSRQRILRIQKEVARQLQERIVV